MIGGFLRRHPGTMPGFNVADYCSAVLRRGDAPFFGRPPLPANGDPAVEMFSGRGARDSG
jgi:hypothetical protein